MSNVISYKEYHGSIVYSAEDNMFVGTVLGVQDSLHFHGFSVDELTQSFHDCIDGYLEMCEALGRSPDKEYKGSFNIRIPSDVHRAADLEARKEGISLNQFVQSAIESKLSSASAQTVTYIVVDKTSLADKTHSNLFQHGKYRDPVPVTQS